MAISKILVGVILGINSYIFYLIDLLSLYLWKLDNYMHTYTFR